MATISEALGIALGHQQAGRLQEAEQIYRQILAAAPDHFDALHLLGVVATQIGKHEIAVQYISRAIELHGTESAFHSNLGDAFKAQGKLDKAVACFRRAVELKPDDAEGHYHLGNVLQDQGELDQAVASYRRALELKPDHTEAYNNLGAALYDQGKLDEAVTSYRRALELKPDLAETHNNLGSALSDQGKLDEAVASYRRALELIPDYAMAHFNLGNAFRAQEKLVEAIESYRRAMELKPDHAVAHNNLGGVFQSQGKLEEAVGSYRRALELKPDYAQAHHNLGLAFHQLGRFDDALKSYARALELRADYADAHFGQSTLKLLQGNFEHGWSEYEWRWKINQIKERECSQPRWDGNPLKERTILLHAEQGFGDTVQFVRYAALVKDQNAAATVVVECQRTLAKLLARSPGIDRLIAEGDELPPFDVHSPLLSLPGIFKTTVETIPANVPYLFADPALVAHWRERLREVRGVRVGINWQGRGGQGEFRKRDIPLEMFVALAEVPRVSLVSLQKGEGREELAPRQSANQGLALSQLYGTAGQASSGTPISSRDRAVTNASERLPIVDFGPDFDTVHGAFMDTAAVMMNLDLVVTSDTAIPHLAGALGVPVWVALPYVPDWRWLLDRGDSPWYPTMRLFRQKQPGDWAGVFAEMEAALLERVGD